MSYKIVYSDHTFDDLDLERRMFGEIDGEVIDGEESEEPVEELVGDADALVVMYHPVDASLMDRMPNCKIVVRSGIGFDIVDRKAATERGIYVTNVPDYCLSEVSDHAIGMILALQRKIVFYNNRLKHGEWDIKAGYRMHCIKGQTLGLVAFGNIGRNVAHKARALGMEVITYDPYLSPETVREGGAEPVDSLDELLERSDVISVHTPLTPETRGMIGSEELSKMKDTAFLINVARGGIIDEKALLKALDAGEIQGAALDVFENEPLKGNDPLLVNEKLIVTPHAAWNSVESEIDRREKTANDVISVLKGERPKYLVNRDVTGKS
ncbi:MAG: C-terminal binding protein [Methanomassiliicoccales archaeon]